MKIRFAAAGLLAILAALPLAAQPAVPDAPKPSILILGTVHFGGSTADLFSPSVPDILTEKRRRELADVIAALKRYQPTKIAVEVTPAGIGKLNASYQAYLKDEYQLQGDEIDQLAFRLARELGHKQLWSADTRMDMDFDAVMAAAAKNGQQPLMAQAMEAGKSGVQEMNQKRDAGTIGALFRWLNSPEMLAASHRPYLYLAQIGSAEDPRGAEVLAGWYKRNLLIYGNLVRLIESPGERILLLIGQGHAKLLSEYVAESPNLRLADPLQYLP
ncbi:MAG TPA: DUF5694 domain-containing protein [Thermoanaerobaculia bacterium]|jgi:hypothetical protein